MNCCINCIPSTCKDENVAFRSWNRGSQPPGYSPEPDRGLYRIQLWKPWVSERLCGATISGQARACTRSSISVRGRHMCWPLVQMELHTCACLPLVQRATYPAPPHFLPVRKARKVEDSLARQFGIQETMDLGSY